MTLEVRIVSVPSILADAEAAAATALERKLDRVELEHGREYREALEAYLEGHLQASVHVFVNGEGVVVEGLEQEREGA